MLAFLVQCTTLYIASWTLWRILRRFVIKSDLDNIPGPPSASLLKGNFEKVFNRNAWAFHKELAEHYGRVVRIDALLGDRQVYVFDPKAVYHIVVKDQHIYEETASFIEGNRLLFGEGLLSTLGERHRKQRKMLAPVFSIAHMRNMIPIFYDVAHKLRAGIASEVADGPQEIDMLKWSTRTALELIGQSGLGHSFDTLADNSDVNPYSVSVKQLIPKAFQLFFIRSYLLSTLVRIGTPRFRRFVIDMMPFWKRVRQLRDITDVIHHTSVEIFEEKKRVLEEGKSGSASGVGEGRDIMSILMKANMEASPEDRLSDVDVLGQMSTLTFAAMDTTSGALSRALHLLATHPEVQEKLRQEVLSVRQEADDSNLSYDELVALPLLDAVCRETLHMYPPFPNVIRTTKRDVTMPLTTPIKGIDGREMAEVIIPKNTNVIISVLNCNRDPALWGPDSHEWKPERWMKPLPQALTEAHVAGIYSHLMTFLGGGRACIGFKFSQLEMKVVLSVLLSNFRFSLTQEEIFWEMTGILTPTVKGRPRYPQLPLQVSLV